MKLNATLFFLLFATAICSAQTPAPPQCYKPITGYGKIARPIVNGLVCFGCSTANLQNITDADVDNSTNIGQLISIFGGNGIAVIDTANTYPAGFITGFNIDMGTSLLNGAFLNAITVSTYNHGVLQESSTSANLFAVPLAGSTSQRSFLYLKTTKAFNEVRLTQNSIGTFLQSLNIYYAMAFDPNCGYLENNGICDDAINGPGTEVSYNGSLGCALCSLQNASNIADGDKNNYASLLLPAAAINSVSVGAVDLNVVYPGGGRAGFVISPNDASTLFSADILNSITVETYLFGQLQESRTYANGNGLLNVNTLTWGDNINKQKIGFVTTKNFNEVRLRVNQGASINIGNLRVYYAFEEPADGACATECKNYWQNNNTAPYDGQLVTGYYSCGFLCSTPWTNRYGLALNALTGAGNVVDGNANNYAAYTPLIGLLGSGMNLTVQNGGQTFPANTFGGFTIDHGGALIQAGILQSITVTFYNGNTVTESRSGGSLVGGSLLNTNTGKTVVGFTATKPFNRMKLNINDGLISAGLGGQYFIYNAFVIGDDDGDGIPDACDVHTCINDKSQYLDADGDGIADACDADSDNDGIPDSTEIKYKNLAGNFKSADFDGDGIPNYLDLDDDNDGVLSLFESGVSLADINAYDPTHNGIFTGPVGDNGLLDALKLTPGSATVNYPLRRTVPSAEFPDFLNVQSAPGVLDISTVGLDYLDQDFNGVIDDFSDPDADGIVNGSDFQPTIQGSQGSPLPAYLYASAIAPSLSPSLLQSIIPLQTGVYPNPVARGQQVSVVVSTNDEMRYRLLTMQGAVVSQGRFVKRTTIGSGALASGMYILQLSTKTKSATYKIIVQ